jgi:hypothetical protein
MNELQILTIFTSKGQTNYPEVEAIISLTESALASLLPSLASIKSRSMQYNGRKTINNISRHSKLQIEQKKRIQQVSWSPLSRFEYVYLLSLETPNTTGKSMNTNRITGEFFLSVFWGGFYQLNFFHH